MMNIYEYWIVTNNSRDQSVNLSKIVGDRVYADEKEAQTVCDRHNNRLNADIERPCYRVVNVLMCYDPDNTFFEWLKRFEEGDDIVVDG